MVILVAGSGPVQHARQVRGCYRPRAILDVNIMVSAVAEAAVFKINHRYYIGSVSEMALTQFV